MSITKAKSLVGCEDVIEIKKKKKFTPENREINSIKSGHYVYLIGIVPLGKLSFAQRHMIIWLKADD